MKAEDCGGMSWMDEGRDEEGMGGKKDGTKKGEKKQQGKREMGD